MPLNIKKGKRPSSKMHKGLALTFSQRRHTDGQEAHKELLNVTNDQGNGNQNQMRYYLTSVRWTTCWQGCGERKPCVLLLGL